MNVRTAHTPGPWTVDGPRSMDIQCRVHRVINSERYPSAFVPAWDDPQPGEEDGRAEAQANARLIAAAPDLLDLVLLVHGSFGGGLVMTFSDADVEAFGAAISKATGAAS